MNHEKRRPLKAFVSSHVGRVRSNNEDACAVSGAPGLVTNWVGDLDCDDGWALLCDGVGGHAAGEVAAKIAIEVMRPMMPNLRTNRDVQNAVNAADQAIFMAMEMRPELSGMGTTIAGVCLRPDYGLTFNAGDSKVFSFHNGTLVQTSTDDVTKSGALLQCLGGFQEPVPLCVHVSRLDAQPNLLICSDGLTDMLGEDKIATLLEEGGGHPASNLVEAALQAGGYDNISAIVIARD